MDTGTAAICGGECAAKSVSGSSRIDCCYIIEGGDEIRISTIIAECSALAQLQQYIRRMNALVKHFRSPADILVTVHGYSGEGLCL